MDCHEKLMEMYTRKSLKQGKHRLASGNGIFGRVNNGLCNLCSFSSFSTSTIPSSASKCQCSTREQLLLLHFVFRLAFLQPWIQPHLYGTFNIKHDVRANEICRHFSGTMIWDTFNTEGRSCVNNSKDRHSYVPSTSLHMFICNSLQLSSPLSFSLCVCTRMTS